MYPNDENVEKFDFFTKNNANLLMFCICMVIFEKVVINKLNGESLYTNEFK